MISTVEADFECNAKREEKVYGLRECEKYLHILMVQGFEKNVTRIKFGNFRQVCITICEITVSNE